MSINDARAQNAFEFIQSISGSNKEMKEFRSLARSFPAMVQNNGINIAVAFLLTKSERHKKLYDCLAKWLVGRDLIKSEELKVALKALECSNNDQGSNPNHRLAFTKSLIELEREEYRLVSQEVMEYASWIKRFAEGRWAKDGKEKQ